MSDCQCAEGAPVGWRRIPGGGRFGPFGPFGSFGRHGGGNNNNNNNNNNNSSSNNNNSSNAFASMLNSLLGLGGGGFGAMLPPMGGGFGFPPGPVQGGFPPFCPPWPDCNCSGSGDGCTPCGAVRWKQFRIVSPEGRECCFPVAVPWWCCSDDDDDPGLGRAQAPAEARGEQAVVPSPTESSAPAKTSMSASQLLMQRYMISNPPRTYGKPWKVPDADDAAYEDEEAE